MTQPYDFPDAVAAARRAAEAQKAGEQVVREASADLAEAERLYRVALAKEITRQHADEKVAWTVAQDMARGEPHVADLRYHRDVAKGVLEAAQQRAWRHTADRKDVQVFLEWSRRVHGLDDAGQQPQWTPRAA
jgi:hypothetical protein